MQNPHKSKLRLAAFGPWQACVLKEKQTSRLLQSGAVNTGGPASEEAGLIICRDQSPLRRDQIRVKPSSPSTLTSEA